MAFLADTITLIRNAVDDPETDVQYTDSEIIHWIENAFSQVIPSVFAQASGPTSVRWNLVVTANQGEYAKPPNVLEIFAAHVVNTKGEIERILRPRSRFNAFGPGIIFDGHRISFVPVPTKDETYRIWYIPDGSCRLSEGPVKTGSTVSAVKLGTPTKGTRDAREMAYGGSVLTLTDTTGQVEEREVNTSSFDGTDHILNVSPDFTITVDTNTTYDIHPVIGPLMQTAVVLETSLMMLAFQGESKRTNLLEKRQRSVMRQLRLSSANEEQIVGGHFVGDTPDNERYMANFDDFI